MSSFKYWLFLKVKWLLPPGVILGRHYIMVKQMVVSMPLCRYSLSDSEIDAGLRFARLFWGLDQSAMGGYKLCFTYGSHSCGEIISNGCTWPFSKISIALRPTRDYWDRVLLHEIGHVALLHWGSDGDGEHEIKVFWDRIPSVVLWRTTRRKTWLLRQLSRWT